MIAHVRVPNFLARVIARHRDVEEQPIIVHDQSRILGVSARADEFDLAPGQFLDTVDIPDRVEKYEFDLDLFKKAQKNIRTDVQRLSPIAESLDLGEFLVDVESTEQFEDWFESMEQTPYPLTASLAPSGWLARVVSLRLGPGEYKVVEQDDYETVLKSVAVSEFWGVGDDITRSLQDVELKSMGEIFHLDDQDLRKLIGPGSRIFKKLFEGADPRPISAFSRPRSLSQELYLDEEDIESKKELKDASKKVLERFQNHLRSSASLAYRLTVTFFRESKNEAISHDFTTPTDEVDVFSVALDRILSDVEELDGLKITADVIVGDVENYHASPQEDANDLEILS